MSSANSVNEGLSLSGVLRRQDEEGFNELPTSKPRRTISIILGILSEPMVYILLGCGLVYFLIGDRQEALMLLGFLLLIVFIEIFQEQKRSEPSMRFATFQAREHLFCETERSKEFQDEKLFETILFS
jgi:magnesium-transporting ATPase (P-type)